MPFNFFLFSFLPLNLFLDHHWIGIWLAGYPVRYYIVGVDFFLVVWGFCALLRHLFTFSFS